jgi:hypothetical protein
VRYASGAQRLEFDFTITNDGSFPVTIGAVDGTQGAFFFASSSVLVAPPSGQYMIDPSRGTAFAPFSIPAHGARAVGVRARFADCGTEKGSFTSFSTVGLTYSLFGVTRHTTFVLPYTVTVRGIGGCPVD